MKKILLLCLPFVAALPAFATVKIGDTYAMVVAEKGQPGGKLNVGGMVVLCYPDENIRLKDGKVVTVSVPKAAALPAPAPRVEPATTAGAEHPTDFTPAVWTTNYADALAQAKVQNRHVFVFFTGSDWCVWCKRLNAEILSTPEFQTYAGEKLILVEVDFPRDKPQTAELVAQNARLQQEFNITGYPSVIVLNSRGKPTGELGYQEGGPGPFIEQLRTM